MLQRSTENQTMRSLITASIAAAALAAFGASAPASAAQQRGSNPACATDASFHPDGIFFAKQCVRLRGDGTCVRYHIITCKGGDAGKRR